MSTQQAATPDPLDDVTKLLDGWADRPDVEGLVAGADALRLDVLLYARQSNRTPLLLRALENDRTRDRDGDALQNRAITICRAIERDLTSLIEREHAVQRVTGRGYSKEFQPIVDKVTRLKEALVDNRNDGRLEVPDECVAIVCELAEALMAGKGLEPERWTYSASATLVRALATLSTAPPT